MRTSRAPDFPTSGQQAGQAPTNQLRMIRHPSAFSSLSLQSPTLQMMRDFAKPRRNVNQNILMLLLERSRKF